LKEIQNTFVIMEISVGYYRVIKNTYESVHVRSVLGCRRIMKS